jgi:hypothetical protein
MLISGVYHPIYSSDYHFFSRDLKISALCMLPLSEQPTLVVRCSFCAQFVLEAVRVKPMNSKMGFTHRTFSAFRIRPSGLFPSELMCNCGSYRQSVGFLGRVIGGTRYRRWLRCCATSRMIAGSSPDEVIDFLIN